MKSLALSLEELEATDRHHAEGDGSAVHLAFLAFVLESVGAWVWMAMIQYFIYRVASPKPPPPSTHRELPPISRASSTTPIRGLTGGELYLLVGGLWVVYGFVDMILASMLDALVWLVASRETTLSYREWRRLLYNLRYWAGGAESGIRGSIKLLAVELIATWFLSRTFILISDHLVPILCELRQDHNMVLSRMRQRAWDVHRYFLMMDSESEADLTARKVGNERENGDQEHIIELSRQRTESRRKGYRQRKLDWRLVIDEDALHEMKEILGPPGGFGELGFSVAEDKVCLGAVRRGSSFLLTFELEPAEDEKRKSVKGGGGSEVEIERDDVREVERCRESCSGKRNKLRKT
ncbi:hypothetical protein DSL72_004358 [Monilinia vaccinii-corymbosi]|uniref:Uncharacterized protein n=1 Tax=Monilinia vaccinii-corymbosi TaxID=61207 RepID=A0A8A3P0A7_9HELO|nr:hypothetical protein DSL72_004358 [Monilinia vaccinii-corymbosi]